jgi:hypothetical protein
LAQITHKITSLTGLPAVVEKSWSGGKGDFDEWTACVDLAGLPMTRVVLTAKRPRIAKQDADDARTDTRLLRTNPVFVVDESAPSRLIYLKCYVGQEETLYQVATLVLEQLGGNPGFTISEDHRREYSVQIAFEELKRRCRVQSWLTGVVFSFGRLLNLIAIPIWLILLPVKMAWWMWTIYRLLKQKPGRD